MSLLDGSCVSQHCLIAGPCHQIAAAVDGLLCGRVGKIVARMEKNCKRLWAASSTGRALGVAWCDISGGNRK